MLTVGSLFSGSGALDLGLERAGMVVCWQCESDPSARAVLAHHWPAVPCYPDVRELSGDSLRVDCLAGGFPCQDLSHAGRRAGLEGESSGLWSEFARLIRELRPRYVFVENVTNLLAHGMGRVLGDLAASGYDAEWDCIPAAAVGAPHLRARLWLLAYARGNRSQARLDDTVYAGRRQPELRARWDAEPQLGRVVDGSTPGVDERLRLIGNAAVPQIAEFIGRRILELEREAVA